MSRPIAAAVLLALLGFAPALRAQDPSSPSDDQVRERLAYIESALRSGRSWASTWWYGSVAVCAVATVAQEALAASHWKDTRVEDGLVVRDRGFAEDMLVGGATTGLAGLSYLISPMDSRSGDRPLRSLPESTPEERRAKLARAEALLRDCARQEKDGWGLATHLIAIGLNAAAGVVTSAAFHRPWTDGLVTFAAGEAFTLLGIYTQPRRAIRDWREYESRYLNGAPAGPARSGNRPSLAFGLGPGGVSLAFRF